MPQIDSLNKLKHGFETIIYNVETGYNKRIYSLSGVVKCYPCPHPLFSFWFWYIEAE
jgi:hypothetical protein